MRWQQWVGPAAMPSRSQTREVRLILVGVECFFACPYCWEQISMVLDTSVKGQTYVEDCEVCCQPIEVRYKVEDGEVVGLQARAIQ